MAESKHRKNCVMAHVKRILKDECTECSLCYVTWSRSHREQSESCSGYWDNSIKGGGQRSDIAEWRVFLIMCALWTAMNRLTEVLIKRSHTHDNSSFFKQFSERNWLTEKNQESISTECIWSNDNVRRWRSSGRLLASLQRGEGGISRETLNMITLYNCHPVQV